MSVTRATTETFLREKKGKVKRKREKNERGVIIEENAKK